MNSEQRSLLPFDEDYVLIHKRTLVVNTATFSQVRELLSQRCGVTPDDIGTFFSSPVIEHFADLPDEEICRIVEDLITQSWQNQDNSQPSTVVTVQNKK